MFQVKADEEEEDSKEDIEVPEDAKKAEPVDASKEDSVEGEKEAPAEGKDEL